MTNKIFYLSILIFSFLSCKQETKSESKNLEKAKIDKIDSLANRYLDLNRFSGEILIVEGDSILYNNYFGLADYDNNTSFSKNTSFKIGEISELITTNIIQELAKKGKLKLDDKIAVHLPEIKSDFTINNLLNHKTNYPSIKSIQEENSELKYSTIDYANLDFQSSITSEKSDLDYNILGLLIEKVSGKSFQENVEDYSKNLALNNTYFEKSDSNLAVGYLYHNYQGNGPELQIAPISNSEITFSSNGLKSTSRDLVKIIRTNSEEKLDINGYLENDGFSYSIVNNPESKIAIIVLSNRRHPVSKEISNSIESILQNKEYNLPLPRKQFDIDTNLLNNYTGSYALNENMNLNVITENDSLFVMMGPNKIHLIPQSENQFYMQQTDGSMRFIRNTENVVKEVELLDGFLEGDKIKRLKD